MARPLKAQDNYEIQVYGAETVPRGITMVELHSNFTNLGKSDGHNTYSSTFHAFHETIEVTRGLSSYMELGVYLFTSENNPQYLPQYVGNHLRWRVRDPEKWHWPLGVSLSIEAGYQKRQFAEDDWNTEIRPIIDKDLKKWYFAINPVFDYAFSGLNHKAGLEFSPQAKVTYKLTKKIQPGIEYYGSVGPLTRPVKWGEEANQLGIVLDLNISPKWEINAGYLVGLTPYVEKGIIKLIVGRRLGRPAVKN